MTLEVVMRNLREQARRYRREAASLDAEAEAIERVLKAATKFEDGPETRVAALEVIDAVFGREEDDDAWQEEQRYSW